ncbi:MAG: hypothetical protein HC817_08190 [Saprospiraceae bacterium]|nr:hypothetical protein [Saprospiraceae bacterium]
MTQKANFGLVTSGTLLTYKKGIFEKITLPFEANTINRLQTQNDEVFIQASFPKNPELNLGNSISFSYKNTPIHILNSLPVFYG